MAFKFISALSVAGLLLAGGASAFADNVSVVGYSGTIWQNWSASNISNQAWQTSQQTTNQPYWNNSSWDGTNENVGGCLAIATSGCKVSNQPGNIPYLGQPNGKAFNDFYFNSTGGGNVTMQAQVAGDAPNDIFGWYNINNPGQYGILFDGSTSTGSTVSFTPSAQYGFFFYNGTPGVDDLFLTDSDLNSTILNMFSNNPVYVGPVDTDIQHFAVFQQTAGTYYIGMEDLPSCNTDFDYNDMVVKISTVATPEPTSLLLLGCGLLAFGATRRRHGKATESK